MDALAACFRKQDKRVAILAIDPTSPFTGGSILVTAFGCNPMKRMTGVYIRSMATRGSLGGLAPAAADVLVALDAAGFDVILDRDRRSRPGRGRRGSARVDGAAAP